MTQPQRLTMRLYTVMGSDEEIDDGIALANTLCNEYAAPNLCRHCGFAIEGRARTARYCDDDCRSLHRRYGQDPDWQRNARIEFAVRPTPDPRFAVTCDCKCGAVLTNTAGVPLLFHRESSSCTRDVVDAARNAGWYVDPALRVVTASCDLVARGLAIPGEAAR